MTEQTQTVPTEDLRALVKLGLDNDDADKLAELAKPIIDKLRERWMAQFVAEMVEELKARTA